MIVMIVERRGGDGAADTVNSQAQLVLERQHLLHEPAAARLVGKERISSRLDESIEPELFDPELHPLHQTATNRLDEPIIANRDDLAHRKLAQSLGGLRGIEIELVSIRPSECRDDAAAIDD